MDTPQDAIYYTKSEEHKWKRNSARKSIKSESRASVESLKLELQSVEAHRRKLLNEIAEIQLAFEMNRHIWVQRTGYKDSDFGEKRKQLFQIASACFAASQGDLFALSNLLENGAEIHLGFADKRTPLHLAVVGGHLDCIRFLLENGSDPDVRDRWGVSPFEEAQSLGDAHIVWEIEKYRVLKFKKEMDERFKVVEYIPGNLENEYSEGKMIKNFIFNVQESKTVGAVPSVDYSSDGEASRKEGGRLSSIRKTFLPKTKFSLPTVSPNRKNSMSSKDSSDKSPVMMKMIKKLGKRSRTEEDLGPEEKSSNETNNSPIFTPCGIAFSVLRGHCQLCDCKFFSEGENSRCKCTHFPAHHVNLGPADESLKRLLENTTKDDLVRMDSAQDWPKILNKDAEPLDPEIQQMQQVLISESPDWLVSTKDVQFSSLIGEGVSAKVYKGIYRHLGQDNEIAIKKLDLTAGNSKAQKNLHNFKQEMDILIQLNSPYIVSLYGVVAEPRICLILEYCSGGALYNELKKDTKIGWENFFQWGSEIIQGLNTLHNSDPQIVHRDLKTLNLLIDADNHIKIADFGLSRIIKTEQRLSTLSKLRGTYCYTAPEIYFGNKYTYKSDIYSLSIILWEIVTKVVKGTYVPPYSVITLFGLKSFNELIIDLTDFCRNLIKFHLISRLLYLSLKRR
eukprot:TRINITY_DN2078_c1_g1_i2.p1 TRINITY_DN2078_c1_g1~~TRINITY_DN2078_c1_g1_i2.p1  ORF type:complete len:677 (+),score=132.36 TRINITY_DN2078_c1_g1_i2:27-2057(+)